MSYRFRLEQFEGPLDLLLSLIETQKLDITTISLAQVTNEYLEYIHERELPPDEVADFLVVAAKLMYLKSKYLLPQLAVVEEEGADLEQQLKIYREYYLASQRIEQMIKRKKFSFTRSMPYKLSVEPGFYPPRNMTAADAPSFFRQVLSRLEQIINLPKIVLAKTVSIREKIRWLKDSLEKGLLRFHELYDRSNKQDMIVSFLALLELVKQRDVQVSQQGLFTDIVIRKQ